MHQNHATAEMTDGQNLGPVRILFADKMQFENSARANGWRATDDVRVQGFLTWAALKRTGETSLGYEEFLEAVLDIDFQRQNPEDDEDTPTKADTSA